ncbi:1-acyl-sn-glycerol-3-phosphate acyltransferase alpha-like [Bacillus rossius redtenbacheri]|uniref:1-acyl-sn-glycerol-3-phosphate acyltransferase alpha-like n=1 Tax=Bacillus rossius redtenbacheri TaxID=93214 RepID=UPI002FDF00C2
MGSPGMTEVLAATLLFLVFLYQVSHVFRYYAKFLVFTLLSLVSATVFIPLMLIRPRDYRNALYPAWGARQISKLLGIRFEMKGLENAVQDTGCVVVINHQSALDLLVLGEIWPKLQRCTVISKKEVLYLGPFGLATWLWGTIFIDRLNVERAQSTINSTADIVRNNRAKLCMFPEGTRNNGATLLPFKKGAFHVAISSQTPVQPVVVSRYYFLDDKKKIFDSGSVIITILPPIPTVGRTKDDVNALVAETRDAMIEVHTKTSEEVIGLLKTEKIS